MVELHVSLQVPLVKEHVIAAVEEAPEPALEEVHGRSLLHLCVLLHVDVEATARGELLPAALEGAHERLSVAVVRQLQKKGRRFDKSREGEDCFLY